MLPSAAADAQQEIFLVRHAEDVRSKEVVDRPLTESGQTTGDAACWRSEGCWDRRDLHQQPAAGREDSGAIASRIEPKPLPQLTTKFDKSDMEDFVQLLRSQYSDNIVLFVGHSNTVPALLKALGHTDEIKIPAQSTTTCLCYFRRAKVLRRFYVLGN